MSPIVALTVLILFMPGGLTGLNQAWITMLQIIWKLDSLFLVPTIYGQVFNRNHTNFNTFYQNEYDNSVNLVSNPDLVTDDLKIAVISALWFFEENVMDNKDIDTDTTVREITELVNGGDKGLDDRKSIFQSCEEEIDCK